LIEVLAEHRHAFSIITKSSAIERDIDLLAPLARDRLVSVYISIPSLDGALARVMEPRATAPTRRLRTMDRLTRAGIPVGVSVSPVIPFLNEPELERVLEQARDAGATAAFATALRLPWEVNPLFQQWLRTHFPDRAARVMARVRDMRGGRDNDSRFGQRMTGTGVWAQLLAQRLRAASQRLGLGQERIALDLSRFRRPSTSVERPAQSSLF
jgi:DNA repair photolyase